MARPRVILALDLGTSCGWAVLSGGKRLESGKLGLPTAGHPGARWASFTRQLCKLIDRWEPDVLAFEDVRRHAGTRAAHVYGGFRACMEVVCMERGLTPFPVGVSTWKKRACGKGNASKAEYVDAMNKRWRMRMTLDREDEAAALGVATAVEAA